MKKIAVYCGASSGHNAKFAREARALGAAIGRAKMGIVFGGGENGLMGEVARSCIDEEGDVMGIIPAFLKEKEGVRGHISNLEVVDSMHLRKERIFQLADAFIALPGGFGTLDEVCEVITWRQLGLHKKPIGLLNTLGFYDGFLSFIKHAEDQGFIRNLPDNYLAVESSAEDLVKRISASLRRST